MEKRSKLDFTVSLVYDIPKAGGVLGKLGLAFAIARIM
jgi:hypothetical protein